MASINEGDTPKVDLERANVPLQMQLRAELEREGKEALSIQRRLEATGEWPGIYAQEVAVRQSTKTKAFASTAAAGLFMHIGLRKLMPSRWLFRTGLVGVSMFSTFKASHFYFSLEGMRKQLAMEHSLLGVSAQWR